MSASDNNLLVSSLVEFGLSDKEAKIYISLLELEIATVNQIAKASGINRSSAYVVLEALKKRGLVSISEDKNVQQYIPTSPSVLLKTAEALVNKQEQIKKNIDAIIPDLKALHKGTKQKPIVRGFEGKEGLVAQFEDSLVPKEKLLRIASSLKKLDGIISSDYIADYAKRRIQNNIKKFGIHPVDDFSSKLLKVLPQSKDEQVLIPEKKFNFPTDLALYDNKIAYMSEHHGGIGVIIESKEMSDVMKSIFDLAFEGAKHTPGSKHFPPQ